jgi:hypothetical protein
MLLIALSLLTTDCWLLPFTSNPFLLPEKIFLWHGECFNKASASTEKAFKAVTPPPSLL